MRPSPIRSVTEPVGALRSAASAPVPVGAGRTRLRAWLPHDVQERSTTALAIGTPRLLVVLALAVIGCAPSSTPPPSAEPPLATVVPSKVDAPNTDDRFCAGIVATVEAWTSAFAGLRQAALGNGRWQGRPLDREFADCTVDGTARISSSYVCTPSATRADDFATMHAMFERIEASLDRCLAEPFWYPRRFAKSPPVDLAGGERQQLWRDQGARPRPALQLKIEQDYRRADAWTVRFTAYSMR